MTFAPVDGIPDIETASVDINELDASMREVVRLFQFAIKQQKAFSSELKNILCDQLSAFVTTHRSSRILIGHVYTNDDYPVVADVGSLAREQVEKLYMIALMLQAPKKWVRRYLRAAWRKSHEEFLLSLEEHGTNPAYHKYLYIDRPRFLETQRKHYNRPERRHETIVTLFAKRVLEHKWEHPVGKNPPWFKRKESIRNYLRDYFDFPTPGTAVRQIRNVRIKKFLYRWYKQYQYLSDYTHIGVGKLLLIHMSQYKDAESARKLKINGERLAEHIIFTSHAAVASSCTLILRKLTNTFGGKDLLRTYWDRLQSLAYFPRALWSMYAKGVLGLPPGSKSLQNISRR